MKTAIALGFALLVAGCATGPYYGGYDSYGYSDPYSTYSYGPSYTYDYPAYYGFPGVIGGSLFYYDRDDGHRDRHWRDGGGRDRDHRWRGRDDDRGRDHPRPPRGRDGLDTRHGEAGNEAGM